ncbi:hypothetical protein KCU71_g22513, partial [Aureobasidium melanogenum]
SQLKTGHPVRSAIHKQLNGRLVLRWVTTWESLLLYVLFFFLHLLPLERAHAPIGERADVFFHVLKSVICDDDEQDEALLRKSNKSQPSDSGSLAYGKVFTSVCIFTKVCLMTTNRQTC